MARRKKPKIPYYLIKGDEEITGSFLMLPPELLQEKAFQSLKPAARAFYLVCATFKETKDQQNALFMALKEYNHYCSLELNEQEIKERAYGGKKYKSPLFVFPEKYLKEYGYTRQNATNLFTQLEGAGFIKIVFGRKRDGVKHKLPQRHVSVYELSNEWKKADHLELGTQYV